MSFRKIWSTARTEYVKWITNPRMIIFGVMIIFVFDYIVTPLKGLAQEVGKPLGVIEPFIAIANSDMIIAIVPAVFLTLISDFPRTDGNTLFFLQRTGRTNWLFGQVLFSIMAIFTYVGAIFVGAVLPMLPNCSWANEWSVPIKQYGEIFPDKAGTFANCLITEKLYNQLPPVKTAVVSYLLIMCYLLILALIMLMFNCLKIKIMGLLSSGAVIAFGCALNYANVSAKWVLPMSHTIIYLHYTKYFREPVFDMWKTVLYFLLVPVGLIFVSLIALSFTDFESVQDID